MRLSVVARAACDNNRSCVLVSCYNAVIATRSSKLSPIEGRAPVGWGGNALSSPHDYSRKVCVICGMTDTVRIRKTMFLVNGQMGDIKY